MERRKRKSKNGIRTSDDKQRIEFIKVALDGVKNCLDDGILLIGCCHWSLMNNFEWQKGYQMTFGICAVDRTTFYGHFLDINDLGEKVVKNQYMVFWQGFFNKDGQWDFRDGMQKQMEFYARNKKIIKIHFSGRDGRIIV